MARNIGTDLDFAGVARIVNIPDAVAPQQPATLAQLNAVSNGQAWKDSVRVATQGNTNLAAPGASIDGIVMVANDRVLVRAQTAQPENGLYLWAGAAVPMVRAPDANTAINLESAHVPVEEGTSAGVIFRQQTVNFVLGTGNVVFVSAGSASGPSTEASAGIARLATQAEVNLGTDDTTIVTPKKLKDSGLSLRKFTATIGDGSATQFTITHNFNTDDVQVEVYRATGAKDSTFTDVERLSVNAVVVRFAAAPVVNAWRVVVIG